MRWLRALYSADPLTAFRARMAFIVGYAVVACGLIVWAWVWARCSR